MILPFVYYDSPILRQDCHFIDNITDEVRTLSQNMIETMDANHGIGIAANQVGYPYRMFVIRPVNDEDHSVGDSIVFINPVIVFQSEEKEVRDEGCLSFPKIRLEIERPTAIRIEALNLEGNSFSTLFVGFPAREVLHEFDHICGTTFFDRAKMEEKERVRSDLEEIKRSCPQIIKPIFLQGI